MVPNEWATVILLGLGPKGVEAAVTNAIANTNCSMRSVIVGTVGGWNGKSPYYGTIAMTNSPWEWPPPVMNAVVPALERCLDDPDLSKFFRLFAAQSLGWLQKDPERAVPALAANLSKTTNTQERVTLLEAFRGFGKESKTARAQVASFLNDSDPNVSIVASNALHAIDFGNPPPITLFGASRQWHLRLRARRFVVRRQNWLDRRIDFRVAHGRDQLTRRPFLACCEIFPRPTV